MVRNKRISTSEIHISHPKYMAGQSPFSEDPTERVGIFLFFTMLAIIVGFIALFLIIRPGTG